MPAVNILTIITGVSSGLGFIGLIAYLYFLQQVRGAEFSISKLIEGEKLFTADQILPILSQFRDDNGARLDALKELTKYDATRARALLKKIDDSLDVTELTKISSKHNQKLALASCVFFSILAIIASVFSARQTEPVSKTDLTKESKVIDAPLEPKTLYHLSRDMNTNLADAVNWGSGQHPVIGKGYTLTVDSSQPVFWTGPRLPAKIENLKFRALLNQNQGAVSWITQEPDDTPFTLRFPDIQAIVKNRDNPAEYGLVHDAALEESSMENYNPSLHFLPALQDELLTVDAQIVSTPTSCIINYTFKIDVPLREPKTRPSLDIWSASKHPRPDVNWCDGTTVKAAMSCRSEPRVGFLKNDRGKALLLEEVDVNGNPDATCPSQ